MTEETYRPWLTRRSTALHVGLALPWLVEAILIAMVQVVDDPTGPVELAVIPAATTAVALLLCRRWWLVGTAVAGVLAGFVAIAGVGLNYIDYSPPGGVAQFVIGALPVVYLIAVLAALVAVAVGVMEWRTSLVHRRSVS